MSLRTRERAGPFQLDRAACARLEGHLALACAAAVRRRAPALAAITVPVPADLDLSACVLAAASDAGERRFCMEQPDRSGFVLAGLGCARMLESTGAGRLTDILERTRALSAAAFVDDPARDRHAPAHAGSVWTGGFAFAPSGGSSNDWRGLAPAQLVLPEIAFARAEAEARMTVSAVVEPGDDEAVHLDRLLARVEGLRVASMPLLDPDPVAAVRVSGVAPPSHYEGAVARAIERIVAGGLSKVVLAREVAVEAPRPFEAGAVFDGLRSVFPGCFSYLVGEGETTFLGASPELLVRREGARAQTVALAGTARRSADPSVDDHLGEQLLRSAKDREEQAIVARRIQRSLDPVSVWVTAAEDPSLVRVHNVQHLATPIRAQLARSMSALELADLLHPTPAVGGEPAASALEMIPELEGFDRGWYAGGVGWTDLSEDGEFCVAIRCALLRGRTARLFAGCGIVRNSVPSEELAEAEIKLQALLPLLV